MKLSYSHSRGITEIVVGENLDVDRYFDKYVVLSEEGLYYSNKPILLLKGGEDLKNLKNLLIIYKFFKKYKIDRSSWVLAVGGGALLDISVFAAGTYMRGVNLALMPTTLLAMVDAAIGGKGAVDWGRIKNLIGVFYQPKLVFCDLKWINTLPHRVYKSAFAELVKYGVVLDSDFFAWLESNVDKLLSRDRGALMEAIYRGAGIKAKIVELDEFDEKGIRHVLNFGHTIGHAVERASGLLHGEAVSIGIVLESKFAKELGYLSDEEFLRIRNLLLRMDLPVDMPEIDPAIVANLIEYDKKRRGEYVLMPLPTGLGKWTLEKVRIDLLKRVLKHVLH